MIVQGDNGTVLEFVVLGDNKIPIDISQANIELDMVANGLHIRKNCQITDALNGKCSATLTSDDLQEVGMYMVQLIVNLPNGNRFASSMDKFQVRKRLVAE